MKRMAGLQNREITRWQDSRMAISIGAEIGRITNPYSIINVSKNSALFLDLKNKIECLIEARAASGMKWCLSPVRVKMVTLTGRVSLHSSGASGDYSVLFL
jgi:hypothetical protein